MSFHIESLASLSTYIKRGISPTYVDDGILIINQKCIRENKINFNLAKFTCRNKKYSIEKFLVKNDILVNSTGTGTVGRTARFNEDNDLIALDSHITVVRPNKDKVNPIYLAYVLSRLETQIADMAKGATNQKELSPTDLGNLALEILPRHLQDKIVDIILPYDDLIENNRRRIHLLEHAARLIYEEWFIRFRFPGHEKVRIVNGLPEHWKMGVISDLFQTGSGGTPSRKENGYYGGDIKWVKTQELKNGYVINTDETISESGLKNSSAKLFPKNTVLMAMYGATIGQLGILNESMASNQACCALIPKTNENYFIFAFLYFLANKEKLIKQSKGSAQNNVSQEIVKNFPLLIPSLNLLDSFTHNLLPSFELIANLQVQNLRLKKARDLLLPKLMNGEIQL